MFGGMGKAVFLYLSPKNLKWRRIMLRIGLIGTGTVGGGVIQILEQKIAEYKEKLGVELELACICAKS